MSFEGTNVCLCKKGHLHVTDCYDELEVCDCGEPIVHQFIVDDTNCDEVCRFDLEQLTPAKYMRCPCCGMQKGVEEETYQFLERSKFKSGYKVINEMKPVEVSWTGKEVCDRTKVQSMIQSIGICTSMEEVCDVLESCGYNRDGTVLDSE